MFFRWYGKRMLIWALIVVPFWWFATGFHGVPFFTLPMLNGPSAGDWWQIGLIIQLAIFAAMVLPPLVWPIIYSRAKRRLRLQ